MSATPIMEINGVSKTFEKGHSWLMRTAARMSLVRRPESLRAVDGVDLAVNEGEVLGLVGESGCGKSTLGRMVAGTIHPSNGTVIYRGNEQEKSGKSKGASSRLNIQMVFQDPYSSLNPRMRIGEIISEAPRVHGLIDGDTKEFISAQMVRVGLDPASRRRYPHQFSGGQRQRICIARALAVNPELLVCDESVAALDVSIQAQILNLFMDLREELGLTYLFISHDLGVVEHIADRVAIMYLGRIVEQAQTEQIFAHPNHPYTQALLAEVPKIEARRRTFSTLKGELPSPMNPPRGCHFHPRCPHAMARCRVETPTVKEIAPGHLSACHLNDVVE